ARLEAGQTDVVRDVIDRVMGRLGQEGGWLSHEEVDACLRAVGLRTPLTRIATSIEEAVEAAAVVGGPVVLKVISASALHKSDVGGVILGVEGPEKVASAYEQITRVVGDAEGALVQEMIQGGHEVLIGMTQDPTFGPLVGFGLGGVYVELLKDVAFKIHPLTDVDAAEMITETKGHRLLHGYRGQPLGDVAALETALLRVSALVTAAPELAEMDLNPVKVLPPGEGVCVVDARIRVELVPPRQRPTMRDLPGVASSPRV
ncbi:MAG: acetate--CoA ligase family protein, partial [Actinobacteria bacterium]|nr:acetate--CoA ligase family protein [Actinomycetota bacterium]